MLKQILWLANLPWTGGHVAIAGIQFAGYFMLALVFLYLSKSKNAKVSHCSAWFLWVTLIGGLALSVVTALNTCVFLNQPTYIHWLVTMLQQLFVIVATILYVFRYKEAFPKKVPPASGTEKPEPQETMPVPGGPR